MERIRQLAIICIGRAVFFGTLAIGCAMIGFAYHPVAIFRAGAMMTLLMAAILLWKARIAPRQDPRSTEVWLYLDERSRPAGPQAQRVFSTILSETYGHFAQGAFYVACGLFAIALVLHVVGVGNEVPGQYAHTGLSASR